MSAQEPQTEVERLRAQVEAYRQRELEDLRSQLAAARQAADHYRAEALRNADAARQIAAKYDALRMMANTKEELLANGRRFADRN